MSHCVVVICSHLNDVDEDTKVTPIMLSVATGNVAVIRDLLLCKVNMNLADYQGNNVFHYAAKATDAQAIQVGLNYVVTNNSCNFTAKM